jgi:ABC-type transport system substrate-binding protein
MPGQIQAPSLAETVTIAKDGRTFDFVLRQNALRRSHKVRLVAPTGGATVSRKYAMMLTSPFTAMEGA